MGHTMLVLTIYVLAAARLTRLVNADSLLDSARLAVLNAARNANQLGHTTKQRRLNKTLYFIECPWCVGFWLAAATAIIPVTVIGWPAWTLIPVALAASHLVGVFAFAADTEEVEVTQ